MAGNWFTNFFDNVNHGFSFLPTSSNSGKYINGIDFLLPGTSILDNLFDPTGQHADMQ